MSPVIKPGLIIFFDTFEAQPNMHPAMEAVLLSKGFVYNRIFFTTILEQIIRDDQIGISLAVLGTRIRRQRWGDASVEHTIEAIKLLEQHNIPFLINTYDASNVVYNKLVSQCPKIDTDAVFHFSNQAIMRVICSMIGR